MFQILKRHFARYTPEMVEQVCGVPAAQFLAVAEALCDNSGPERTSAICYSVGWTQHTVGAQIIRTAAIIQLLLKGPTRYCGIREAVPAAACLSRVADSAPALTGALTGALATATAIPYTWRETCRTLSGCALPRLAGTDLVELAGQLARAHTEPPTPQEDSGHATTGSDTGKLPGEPPDADPHRPRDGRPGRRGGR